MSNIDGLKSRVAQAATATPDTPADAPADLPAVTDEGVLEPTAVTIPDRAAQDSLFNWLKEYRGYWRQLLPSQVSPDAFELAALAAIMNDEYLAKVARSNARSLVYALSMCAHFGLIPDGVQAAIVPFGGSASFIPMYRGYITLLHRYKVIKDIRFNFVREGDTVVLDNGKPAPDDFSHVVNILADIPEGQADRTPLVAYCYAWLPDGTRSEVVTMPRERAIFVRDEYSRAYQNAEENRVKYPEEFAENPRKKKFTSPWHTPDGSPSESMWLKGLALDTPIATPSGWTTMGMVSAGDTVFDMHGAPTRVTAKSEVKHLNCYRFTFANGTQITCDEEHLWLATLGINGPRKRAQRGGWDVLKASALYDAHRAGERIVMPVTEPLELDDAPLPIDPWLLGFWLGDGDCSRPGITCNIDNVEEVCAAIGATGYQVGAVRKDTVSRGVHVGIRGGLGKDLADLGVLGNKHIPAPYMRGSARQRLALLRGLVDSDGGMGNGRGRAYFYNTNRALAEQVAELARSLGEMVNVIGQPTTGYGKTVTSWRVSWQPRLVPATLSEKVARYTPRTYAPYRSIKTIERIDSVPTQCIAVDAPTRTYLAGVDMVPTHNSVVRLWVKRMDLTPPALGELIAADAADSTTGQQVTTPAKVMRALATPIQVVVSEPHPYHHDERTDPYCGLDGCTAFWDDAIHQVG